MVFTEIFQCLMGHEQEKDHCLLKNMVQNTRNLIDKTITKHPYEGRLLRIEPQSHKCKLAIPQC